MGKIVILDENTSNQIAAGEVVERPASVVKELVENSIDAGANSISVEISNGGISLIKVMDNGKGFAADDMEIAFERHSTSKIRNANDLETVITLGFRGEALASIASVSTVELTSRQADSDFGRYIRIQGGTVLESRKTGCPAGTTFIVRELFYNTPARFKFLKKDSTEARHVSDIVSRVALGNPHISFRCLNNKNTVIHTPGNNDILSAIFSLYGNDIAKKCIEVSHIDEKIEIWGYIGRPEISRANRNHQSIYLNGRYIKSKIISAAIDQAYKTHLLKNKHPFVVLYIKLNPMLVDVNVHPAKTQVRFSGEQDIFRSVYHAINDTLLGKSQIRNVALNENRKDYFAFEETKISKENCIQQKLDTIKKKREITSPPKHIADEKTPIDTGTIFNSSKPRKDMGKDNISNLTNKEEIKREPKSREVSNMEQIENATEHTLEDIFNNSIIIGQAFSTYILLQSNDRLILVDQHAAHERVMFEKIRNRYKKAEDMAQYLLTSLIIELTNQESDFVKEKTELLKKLGFIFESFGNNSIILRSVPIDIGEGGIREAFLEIIDLLMSKGRMEVEGVEDEILYRIACKSAIKANKRLNEKEIRALLDSLATLENPYTCPHGRPTIIKINRRELEKMFKRIV